MNAAHLQDFSHQARALRNIVGGASLCVVAGVLGWLVEYSIRLGGMFNEEEVYE
jgi:hypothetical protein